MEQWVINLIDEHAELQKKCLNLTKALSTGALSKFNEGDNMYDEMCAQLTAMMNYKYHLEERIAMVWKRLRA